MNPIAQQSALDILRHDHRRIKDLFKASEESEDLGDQHEAVGIVIREWRIHAQLEQEVFFPALRQVASATHWIDQAEEELQEIESIISDLQEMDAHDPLISDKFVEFEDRVLQHIQEMENDLFPQAEEADLNLRQLGQELQSLRQRKSK